MRIVIDTEKIGLEEGTEMDAAIAREVVEELARHSQRMRDLDDEVRDETEREYDRRVAWFSADLADRLRTFVDSEWSVDGPPIPERLLRGAP